MNARLSTLIAGSLLCLSSAAVAQTAAPANPVGPNYGQQGSMYVIGSLSFSSTTGEFDFDGDDVDMPDVSTYTVQPQFGYFVAESVSLAVTAAIDNSKEDDGDVEYTTQHLEFLFSPAYHVFLQPGMSMRLHGDIGYRSDREEVDYDGGDEEQTGGGVVYGAGADFELSVGGRIGGLMRLGASYRRHSGEYEYEDLDYEIRQGEFRLDAGFGMYF